jgi:hypothetical protein
MRSIPSSREAGFFSIHLLALIVFLLLVTGAGQYLWRNSLQLGSTCQKLISEIELYQLNDTCMAIGTNMASLRNRLEQMVAESPLGGGYMDLEEFSGMMARKLSSQTLGFNSPELSGMIDPKVLGNSRGGGSSLDKMRLALTQGSVGSQYMSQGNAKAGLPYLRSSANMGEYGVLSQLSLGSAYTNGSGGTPRDLQSASHYNRMALDSIRKLQSSGTPDSQKLLNALPASPDQMTKSLQRAIAQIETVK